MAVYEHPLNEKIRLFLRLNYLISRFDFHLEDPSRENCQAASMVLLELYNLSSRLDVKNAALHVLDWQTQAVRQAEDMDGVDATKARHILEKLEEKSKRLYSFRGQLGQHLKTHNFLNILKQRASIAGGINAMDVPLFSYWLSLPTKQRVSDLKEWARPYTIACEAVQLLMDLIYEGAEESQETAEGGFYQLALNPEKSYQVLRIELPEDALCYPEISAGKQRFSVRFVDATKLDERGQQIHDNVKFSLKLFSF